MFLDKKLIPSVKHDGGSIVVGASFAARGPGWLAITGGAVNF